MKACFVSLTFLICLIGSSIFPGRTTTDPFPALPAVGVSLLDLVPATALAAIEIRDLDRRWPEIRNIEPIAQFQDVVLSGAGLTAELVPLLAGERAVFMLLSSGDTPQVIPAVLLQPRYRREALRWLKGSRSIHFCDARGALWVGPISAADPLEQIARREDPGLRSVLPFEEIDARLPSGGLARGYVNPRACAELLGRLVDRTNFELPRWAASWLEAELSAVRYIAFRRDIAGGEIETDAVEAYDLSRLPTEVAGVFAPGRAGVPEASSMPVGAFAAFAFRPEPEAWVPWLRYLAARDPHGPMRNLGFQLDDFQKRYGRDLRRDLCDAIGERGWLFLMKGERIGSVSAVALIETHPAAALERTLMDLLDWAGEQIWIDSLGTLLLRPWNRTENGIAVRGVDLWTPLGKRTGFAFALAGRYLVLANSDSALRSGFEVAGRLRGAETTAPHASMHVQGAPIAQLFLDWLNFAGRSDDKWMASVTRLIAGIEEAQVEVHYEPDAVRFEGRARFSAR